MVTRRRDVRVAKHHQRACAGPVDEPQGRLEHHHARALAADQSAGEVEALFRQQLIQVVARHASRNVWESGTDQVRVPVAQTLQSGVDLAAPTAVTDDLLQLRIARAADAEPQAIVREDLELLDVVRSPSSDYGMHAARVV